MQRFRLTMCAALGVVALSLSGTLALAQQKYTLKFNHVLGPKEPYHDGFLKWAKAVEERTKGGLKIDVFHSAQLGREEDIIALIEKTVATFGGLHIAFNNAGSEGEFGPLTTEQTVEQYRQFATSISVACCCQ